MVFSSISFLFFFLPLLFLVYFIVPKRFKNYVLLVFSLLFYFFGEKWYIILLILSCLVNYLCGILMEKKNKKLFLIIGLFIDLGLLIYYKYTNFFIGNFNNVFGLSIGTLKIILPLGISFFTFQNISYLVDVYRGEVKAQKNMFLYSTYISLFPQLVAGPIVRYKDINKELENRSVDYSLFSSGVIKFVIGLGKKVIIADSLYNMYSSIMSSQMSVLSYFLVAVGFTLQIYYDFSGYSDMAIGLGRMFGFNFKENFNYPLISGSVTEFWRRWHMSLSSFFRDYVYIPLGGNRKGLFKTIRNIFIVWFLTGMWHGASWNFIIWGLYFFVFLIIEKFFLKKYMKNGVISHIYTFVVILVSFVIFSVTDLSELVMFLKGLMGIGVKLFNHESVYYFKIFFMLILVSLVGISPLLKNKLENLKKGKLSKFINVCEVIWVILVFTLSVATLISSTFNPFIYFRF